MQIHTPRHGTTRRAPVPPGAPGRTLLSAAGRLVVPYSMKASSTDDLEEELRRNFKLRRELGAEIRLELLTTDAADKKDANHLGTLTRLIVAAWITIGLIALALAAFMAIWVA